MTAALLALNAGSSSLKFAVYPVEAGAAPLLRGEIEELHASPRFSMKDASGRKLAAETLPHAIEAEEALELVLRHLQAARPDLTLAAAAHRVVHGGETFTKAVMATPETVDKLEALDALAPLHQPHNLAAVRALMRIAPGLMQTLSFDTAFHADQPEIATRFALPQWLRKEGVRRYGFHGLSYAYIAGALPDVLGSAAAGRLVVAHLGQGASMCAMKEGRSVATTMGFSALEGLMMGTRCGSLDPGVILYLMDSHGMGAAEISRLLYQESGLKGVSGLSGDMRILQASPEPSARIAIDLFAYRIARELGSLAAALGGLDALVFTGGIGANSDDIRRRVSEAAHWLGAVIDPDSNAAGRARFDAPGSRVALVAMQTDEESMLAKDCRGLLA